jgi:hypothetical protein
MSAHASGMHVKSNRKYRQYMNRRGPCAARVLCRPARSRGSRRANRRVQQTAGQRAMIATLTVMKTVLGIATALLVYTLEM